MQWYSFGALRVMLVTLLCMCLHGTQLASLRMCVHTQLHRQHAPTPATCVCICLHTCVHSLDLLLATILLSGPKCPDTWVANYSGGCAPEGTLIPPPHATALPHMLGCYGNLSTNLHPLLGKGRVKETFLAGLGLISSKGKSLSAIQVCCKHLILVMNIQKRHHSLNLWLVSV